MALTAETKRALGEMAQMVFNETALFSDEDMGSQSMRTTRNSRKANHKLGSLPDAQWVARDFVDMLAQVQFLRVDDKLHIAWIRRLEHLLQRWTHTDTLKLIEHQARRMAARAPEAVAREWNQRHAVLNSSTYLRALLTKADLFNLDTDELASGDDLISGPDDDEIDREAVMAAAWPSKTRAAPEEFGDIDAQALLTAGTWGV